MQAAEIRDRFLSFFRERGHDVRPSGSLVPGNDPTLLFTNAGMVQFKQVFLGREDLGVRRAVTAQKCVRAGGKHNDLEQVGETARHHTFFEMLGNFSFGDYFKKDAVRYAWDFLTVDLGLDPDRLYATVHHTDDEAFDLWRDEVGIPAERIFRLGDKDNFWQMADTGPCGPCSELHYDLRPEGERGVPDQETFEELGEAGVFLELWNLVFMQFDRDAEGTLHPLPAPSIDTGAGLERIAAVLQQADSNYHTDLFRPLLDRAAEVVGRRYEPDAPEGVSFRVLADHARAVAFLVADGVFPSSDGRGYVLRRILRRAVRHAWLLGRREPTLVGVVDAVVDTMGEAYPELREQREQLLRTTRVEEERFLATIEGGMRRFDELAPLLGAEGLGDGEPGAGESDGGEPVDAAAAGAGAPVIPGDEAFRLHDTFGFPLDLTELMARERGYAVDVAGFEAALEEQRSRSRADRAATSHASGDDAGLEAWDIRVEGAPQRWVGWDARSAETRVVAVRAAEAASDPAAGAAADLLADPAVAPAMNGSSPGARHGIILEENPFYAEAGGQISDTGIVEGDGWRMRVEDVRKVDGLNALFGPVDGELPEGAAPVRAHVQEDNRKNIERNHTATHLLHAALRDVLGTHVRQRGSLVAADRLRFDFSHPGPVTAEELTEIERRVNDAIWVDHPVEWSIVSRDEATARGAMALFGEKYGDEVRMVEIPGVSLELCGGTHLRHTGSAGPFRVTRESGVASGVRRIEAVTGPGALAELTRAEGELDTLGDLLRVSRENLPRRVEQLIEERGELERLVDELRRSGGGGEDVVVDTVLTGAGGIEARYRAVEVPVRDADDARTIGDAFRGDGASGVLALAARSAEGKASLFVFVTDDLIRRGIRAGDLVGEIAAIAGGRGGGRPHMAQGGVEDPTKLREALTAGEAILLRRLGEAA